MLRTLKKQFLSSIACFITLIAVKGVSVNSMWYLYEPEIPGSLRQDL